MRPAPLEIEAPTLEKLKGGAASVVSHLMFQTGSLGQPPGFSIAAGDFNNDGAPDLALPIEEYGKVAILLNTK